MSEYKEKNSKNIVLELTGASYISLSKRFNQYIERYEYSNTINVSEKQAEYISDKLLEVYDKKSASEFYDKIVRINKSGNLVVYCSTPVQPSLLDNDKELKDKQLKVFITLIEYEFVDNSKKTISGCKAVFDFIKEV